MAGKATGRRASQTSSAIADPRPRRADQRKLQSVSVSRLRLRRLDPTYGTIQEVIENQNAIIDNQNRIIAALESADVFAKE